jgi:putative endonuclease
LVQVQQGEQEKVLNNSGPFMFYIYILYSPSSDKYYLGFSNDPNRRLVEHNTNPFNTYTSKHRPWILKTYFKCSKSEQYARNVERFIKKQKSRKLLEQLCDPSFIPTGFLAQLVRVPDIRD